MTTRSPINRNSEFSDLPPILTVKELADVLRVNPKTLYEAIDDGQIPGVQRIGRRIVIVRDVVVDWLCGGRGSSSR